MEFQVLLGALVCVQVWATTEPAVSEATETTNRSPKVFIGRLMNLIHSDTFWNHCQHNNLLMARCAATFARKQQEGCWSNLVKSWNRALEWQRCQFTGFCLANHETHGVLSRKKPLPLAGDKTTSS